ncbi:MAG TPA: YdeI/OmpD-associated family protein [Streptosporangiaceae bacterium]
MPSDELPVLGFPDPVAWQSWLDEHHADAPGAWLKIAKKGSAATSVSYAQALEVALCYGWIDGQKGRLDDDYWLQRFTPRKRGSRWSKINADQAAGLIEAGRMQPAGQREVDAAQADGRWDAAYSGQRTMAVPDDLERELAANDEARAFFATLSSANRYAILYRIGDAKRPETRARRVAKYVAMLAAHETIHPQS